MSPVLYFIGGEQIPVLDLLRENEIPVLKQTISGLSGIVFPAEHKETALTALDWNQDEVREIPTSQWSTDQLAINWPTDEPKVQRAYEQPSHEWHQYLELVYQWCQEQQFSWPVTVHYKEGEHVFYENGKIHLCFGGSAPYQIRVWDYERDIYYQRHHLWIGELGPQHLWCQELIPEVLSKFLPRIIGEEKGSGQKNFVEDEINYLALKKIELSENLKTARRSVNALQAQLVKAIRQEEELEIKLETTSDQEDDGCDRLRALFHQLKSRSYVKQVKYRDGIIQIFTERITILEGDNLYDIGEFCINIYTDGQEGGVRICNLTPLGPKRLHHPHINNDGYPCLGNIKRVVSRYIAKREYLALTDILYNYLKSVNVDDERGSTIVSWPHFS